MSATMHETSLGDGHGTAQNFDAIARIPVNVQIVIGSATMSVADLMALRRGAVITLDRRIGQPVDVIANGRIVARGDLRVLDDEDGRFGIAVTEIVSRGA